MRYTKIEPKKFSDKLFFMKGISKKTIDEHLKLYQGYINKYNEIREKLTQLTDEDYTKGNQAYSNIRELKTELSFVWGGVVNHELYFSHLRGNVGTVHEPVGSGQASSKIPDGTLFKQIKDDFGSFEDYKKDLKATAMAARGWAWTAWNYREKKLFNYLGDSQNTFLVWEVRPILALDTYEHAYFIDYGTNRSDYINAFFDNLDWTMVEKNFKKTICCNCCDEKECNCK